MTVFTGQLRYVEKKIQQLIKQGYRVVQQHRHPDQTVTVKMER
jgi:hypothetical protein